MDNELSLKEPAHTPPPPRRKSFRKFLSETFLLLIIFFSLAVMGKFLYTGTYVKHHNKAMLLEIQAIQPEYFKRFDAFIREVETRTNWRVYITSAYRTDEEQHALREADARNARSGKSKHNLGRAIDINLYPADKVWRGWLRKKSPKKAWEASGVLPIAEKHRLKWGGNFKTYYDPVHFELQ